MNRTTRTTRTTTWIAGTALTALLAACSSAGSTTTSTLPSYTPSASATTSATATAATSASPTLGYTPADPDGIGNVFTFTGITGITARQKTIYATWVRHQKAKAQALNGKPDWKEIIATTDDRLLRAVARQVNQRQTGKIGKVTTKGKFYTIGTSTLEVIAIDDSARKATITYCADDETYEVDGSGTKATPPPGLMKITEVMTRSGSTWKVVDQPKVTQRGCTL